MEVLMAIGYIALGLTACVANCCLITTILSKEKLRTVTNILVASLACSDFLLAIIVVPVECLHYTWNNFQLEGYACLGHQLIQIFIPLVSIFHLLVVSLERFLKIVYPLRYNVIATKGRAMLMLLGSWITPLIISSLPFTGWNKISHSGAQINSTLTQTCETLETLTCSFLSSILITVVVIYLIMVFLYIKIFSIAISHAKKIGISDVRSQRRSRILKSEFKALVVLAITVGYFFISWSPLGGVIASECTGQQQSSDLWSASLFIAYLNSLVNPFIYGVGNREIREHFLGVCRYRTNRIQPGTVIAKPWTTLEMVETLIL